MSNPHDPAPSNANTQDAQETLAYAYLDDQPTAVYPRYDAAQEYDRPSAYAPPPYASASPSQPPYGSVPLQPPATSAYAVPAPDERPKTLGKLSLGAAIAGTVVSVGGFLPFPGISLALALVGGLLVLTALVLGIATLAKRAQGGKGLGVGGIIVSIIGGGVFIAALFVSLIVLGLSSAAPAEAEAVPEETIEEVAPPVEAGGYDEEAYLAQVRPELNELVTEISPEAPGGLVDSYPDEALVGMGKALLVGGDFARDALATTLGEASGDLMTEEQASRFVDIIYTAAQAHLAE